VQLREAIDVSRRVRRARQRFRLDDEAALLASTTPSGAHLFHIDAANLPALTAYLVARRVFEPGEIVTSATTAGDGNMNCTLRVTGRRRSVVVKQGRPWVEKYPHIAAPSDRTRVEAAFYRAAADCPAVSRRMPALLDGDEDARVIVLEDLGAAGDFTGAYGGAAIGRTECESLIEYLVALHQCTIAAAQRATFRNREMRALNHEHMFRFPLDPSNGLALDAITPGLQAEADALKRDTHYVDRVSAAGMYYLADGDQLVHGDFFPGSWLRSPSRDVPPRVIDPEFCFLGRGEFDFGVMLAHLRLASQPAARIEQVEQRVPAAYDASLVRRFAGVEIMRRLIGVAQLPLPVPLDVKRRLLDDSRCLVLA
jgi:5-methylthioribose kinase